MSKLQGKTLFITGASRGIGKSIALRAARDGANIVVVAKTKVPHPKLPGTIHTAAEEIEAAGGQALAVATDIRSEEQVVAAVEAAVERFGGIDILVNNASAILLTGTEETPMKRFDLMWEVNARGTFVCVQKCLPHLREASNPHVLTLSPPISLDPTWLAGHAAYTMSKYGMSLFTRAFAEEFGRDGIAFNALWPRTVIDTAAISMLEGRVARENTRSPEIVADAAYAILTQDSRRVTGNFFIDEQVLAATGVHDFSSYAVDPEVPLMKDLFLD